MGAAQIRKMASRAGKLQCIFCGGKHVATTTEHCPPRSLFRKKHWPEGYDFPACENCNGGTSDDELLVSFVALMGGYEADNPEEFERGTNLMRAVKNQLPGFLEEMFTPALADAALSEAGVVHIPDALHRAVGILAGKLTKGVYNMQTRKIFPVDGGIMFQWFTNAQLRKYEKIVVLDAFSAISSMSTPKVRSGKDLKDQFDYLYSVSEERDIHVLQVVIRKMFGFVTIFSQTLRYVSMTLRHQWTLI